MVLQFAEKLRQQRTLIDPKRPNEAVEWQPASNQTALVVSSTSWTEDEDIGMLLNAIQLYDKQRANTNGPNVIFVITGLPDYCALFY